METATPRRAFSLTGIISGFLLAVGIRMLVQGLKEPVGSMSINTINLVLDRAYPEHTIIAGHVVSWPLPVAYLVAGAIAVHAALWLGSRLTATKPKPLPKQGL